jgi:hypothetical protein
MGARDSPIDPAEWELAAAQLEDIMLANEGEPRRNRRDAILRWHMQAVGNARADAWIPGLGDSREPAVEQALSRFYRHHMRVTIGRLRSENLELRRKLLDAVACVRFYATGTGDSGQRARRMLERLDQLSMVRVPAPAAQPHRAS